MVDELVIVPANEASWDDVQAVFGTRGDAARCQCQRYKLGFRLRAQADCGHPDAPATTGLVAYLDGTPVGWCAVEPRSAYHGLVRNMKVPWEGRDEDRADDSVWAVTCFVTRAGFRRRGVSRALARAAVDFAREQGARAVEAYPMTTTNAILGEQHVGTVGVFAAAGLVEIARPTVRRAVMRIDFT